jgi:hypothetical protein
LLRSVQSDGGNESASRRRASWWAALGNYQQAVKDAQALDSREAEELKKLAKQEKEEQDRCFEANLIAMRGETSSQVYGVLKALPLSNDLTWIEEKEKLRLVRLNGMA